VMKLFLLNGGTVDDALHLVAKHPHRRRACPVIDVRRRQPLCGRGRQLGKNLLSPSWRTLES